MKPKYPDITVKLVGEEGNALMIMGLTQRALKKAKVPQIEIAKYLEEATSGDYNKVLQTTMKWVHVE